MNIRGLIPVSRVAGVIVLLGALANLGLAAYFYSSTRSFLAKAVRTTGTVVKLRETDGEHGTMFAPVFTFTDEQGQMHQVYSTVSSSPPQYAVGERVEVLYVPGDPKGATINSTFGVWGLPIVFGILGGAVLAASLAIIFFVPFVINRLWPAPGQGGNTGGGT